MCTRPVIAERSLVRPAPGKMAEDWCLAEEEALNMTTFFPLGTDLPPKRSPARTGCRYTRRRGKQGEAFASGATCGAQPNSN
jgi:hypothetical protein